MAGKEQKQPRLSHFRGPEITEACPSFRPYTSVLQLLLEGLHRNGDAVAMIECESERSATFADILQKSTSLAAGLRSAGVAPGDFVMFCCDKSILAFSLLLGTMFVGATAAVVPFYCMEREILKGQKVKAIFYDKVYESSLTKSINRMTLKPCLEAAIDDQHPVLASLLQPSSNFTVYKVEDNKKHTPLVLFSSGTTGNPKGIKITDVTLQISALFSQQLHLTCRSLFTVTSLYNLSAVAPLVLCIINGYRLIMSNILDPRKHFQIFEKYKINWWYASLCFVKMYIKEPSYHQYDLSSITNLILVGENMHGSVIQEFGRNILDSKAVITIQYGMTETGILTFWVSASSISQVQSGTCGTPAAGVEIKIVDDNGTIVPIGCWGKIRAKSISMTTGYWYHREMNGELFDEQGFLRTGDFGYFTDDGVLHHLGRECDLIVYKGLKVSVVDLENLLLTHPDVEEAAIVGKPHPIDNEHMVAFIVKATNSTTTGKDIITYFNDRVKKDELKLRGGVIFLDTMPRIGAVSKVKRNFLKDLALSSDDVEL